MKIMHCVDELHFGGLENHIALFTNELLKRSHQVFLHAMTVSPYYLTKIKSQNKSFQYFIGEEGLLQKTAVFNPDIIHIHPFNSIYRGCRIAWELHKPLILTMHGLYDNGIDKSPKGRETSRSISRIIAVDQGVSEFLTQHAAEPEKVSVIRNGLDLSYFYPLAKTTSALGILGLKQDWFTIALVSRFAGGKELPVFNLLEIAPAIAGRLGGLNIILVGDGPHMNDINKECQLLCARNPRIKIAAVGMQMDVRPFLAMADLVASCDMAATEAMACRRPILAAFPKGFYGIVNKNNFDDIVYRRCGTHSNLSNKKIVKQIIALASDKQYWDQVSNESCKMVRENYNIIDSVTQLERVYCQNV
ncbi:MAG TPA: glycosyltransferase family 4 protein [Syntrophomonadaceae bacterium]|nr:glycosyltransferase family 4 protein [Syntrophomonadaceae bacterium]